MSYAKINLPKHFLEITQNFTDPREAIREGIQDAVDAKAKTIYIDLSLEQTGTGMSVKIVMEDDGVGIPLDSISSFFDLSESTKVGGSTIGYKGLGTATYYNSEQVKIESYVEGKKYISIADKPYESLFNNQLISYSDAGLVTNTEGKFSGVRVTILGYMKNTGENHIDLYSHPVLKDYIRWKTAFASIQPQFEELKDTPKLYLRTFDSEEKSLQEEFKFAVENGYEEISFGHVFPKEDVTKPEQLKKIAEEARLSRWDELYCKRVFAENVYIDGLMKPVQILIWIEGNQCKKSYNPMIRDSSRANSLVRKTMYKVQDRYGFWACKDYVPIQMVNDWVVGRGSYTHFHAFVNFDDFSLTANRSSINNTNPNTISKIKNKLNEILAELNRKKELKEIHEIQENAENERSAASEDSELAKRLRQCKTRKSVVLGNVRYYEPKYEGEAVLLFMGVLQCFPNFFPYEILDYNTNKGTDMLVRENPDLPIENDSTVGYLELKCDLQKYRINHSFSKLRVICIYDKKGVSPGNVLVDLSGKKLMLKKVREGLVLADYLGEVGHSIRLLVIKDFLESQGKAMA